MSSLNNWRKENRSPTASEITEVKYEIQRKKEEIESLQEELEMMTYQKNKGDLMCRVGEFAVIYNDDGSPRVTVNGVRKHFIDDYLISDIEAILLSNSPDLYACVDLINENVMRWVKEKSSRYIEWFLSLDKKPETLEEVKANLDNDGLRFDEWYFSVKEGGVLKLNEDGHPINTKFSVCWVHWNKWFENRKLFPNDDETQTMDRIIGF